MIVSVAFISALLWCFSFLNLSTLVLYDQLEATHSLSVDWVDDVVFLADFFEALPLSHDQH